MFIYFECIVVYLQRLMDTMLELSFASDFVITMKKSNNFIPYVYYYYYIYLYLQNDVNNYLISLPNNIKPYYAFVTPALASYYNIYNTYLSSISNYIQHNMNIYGIDENYYDAMYILLFNNM